MPPSPGIPLGWDYNPSTWSQRVWLIIFAVLGFFIALYLALYQWKIIPEVWEPFFENGSIVILNSSISHLLPIPDAAIGALGFLFDAITGAVGGTQRWRTMPWIVVLFGILIGPLGAVSLLLVIFQPVLFNHWCTLCLFTAIISIAMISPAADEVLASLQYLKQAHISGKSIWRAFWGKRNIDVAFQGDTNVGTTIKRDAGNLAHGRT